ncbi:hypothetical protein [Streptosporangium sp. NBC_01756]|uniref:hypothetical protein n=1 Tax=Streptosporangium sp. NBC_01756 TaxID=2975950 RepID=UPI002DD99541|nr:hypothetical protein [Streptosporangium sp. NBC_01756]WSC90070.1 hypothetical protein OIE48_18380 [Streptosporangium sp. NBC_01756]
MTTVQAGRDLWNQRHPAKQTTKPTPGRERSNQAAGPTSFANNTPLHPEPPTIDQARPNAWRDNHTRADWQPGTQADNVHVGGNAA